MPLYRHLERDERVLLIPGSAEQIRVEADPMWEQVRPAGGVPGDLNPPEAVPGPKSGPEPKPAKPASPTPAPNPATDTGDA